MKTMNNNRRKFHYCLYIGLVNVLDEDGYETGEKQAVYTEPISQYANISAAKGDTYTEQFGNFAEYDKTIVIHNPNFPMDENSVLFVDKEPEFQDGIPLYDYIVKKVARSLNSVAYAIARVTNGEGGD